MKLRLAAALLGLAALTPSCLGPDNAYNSLKNWNANVSDSDIAREALFLGMSIIPIYGFALLADSLVFNTVEYWSGSNIIDAPEAWPANFHSGD